MAPLHFVKKARKPVYAIGKIVTYQGRKGSKREGRTMSKRDRTLPADKKDRIIIQKGESYYWWQFINGPINYSKTQPKRSQLTQSEFYGWLWDLEDQITEYAPFGEELEGLETMSSDDLSAVRDEWVQEIESQKDELDSKLDNMPDGLRDSSVLNERVEGLESWISDLEAVDLDFSDDELKQEADDEWEQQHTKALQDEDPSVLEEKPQWVKDRWLELKQEKIEELVGELQNCSSGI